MENLKTTIPTIEELVEILITEEEKLEKLKEIPKGELTDVQYLSLGCIPARINSLKWKIKNYSKYYSNMISRDDVVSEKERKNYHRLYTLLREKN